MALIWISFYIFLHIWRISFFPVCFVLRRYYIFLQIYRISFFSCRLATFNCLAIFSRVASSSRPSPSANPVSSSEKKSDLLAEWIIQSSHLQVYPDINCILKMICFVIWCTQFIWNFRSAFFQLTATYIMSIKLQSHCLDSINFSSFSNYIVFVLTHISDIDIFNFFFRRHQHPQSVQRSAVPRRPQRLRGQTPWWPGRLRHFLQDVFPHKLLVGPLLQGNSLFYAVTWFWKEFYVYPKYWILVWLLSGQHNRPSKLVLIYTSIANVLETF